MLIKTRRVSEWSGRWKENRSKFVLTSHTYQPLLSTRHPRLFDHNQDWARWKFEITTHNIEIIPSVNSLYNSAQCMKGSFSLPRLNSKWQIKGPLILNSKCFQWGFKYKTETWVRFINTKKRARQFQEICIPWVAQIHTCKPYKLMSNHWV